MISFRIARQIQTVIRECMGLSINVYENAGNLSSDPSSELPYHVRLSPEEMSGSDSRTVRIQNADETLCYISGVSELLPEQLTAIRLFVSAVSQTVRRHTSFDANSWEESRLASRILSSQAGIYRNEIISAAADLGYQIDHPISVIVVRLEINYNYSLNLELGYENAASDAKESILNILKHHRFFNKQDLITYVNNNDLVILKAVESMDDMSALYRAQDAIAAAVDEVLRPYRVFSYYISAGRIARKLDEAWGSYEEAVSYISYARKMNIDHPVVNMEDVLYSSICTLIPDKYMVTVIRPKVEKLQRQNPEMIDGLIMCFNGYVNNGFKITTTAMDEYMHRNTVKKRLEKLHQLTGFDPMGGFNDIFLTKVIIQLYQISKGEML